MINYYIKKISACAYGARIIFFNALNSKFAIFQKKMLFETYTGMHIVIIQIYYTSPEISLYKSNTLD